MKSPHGKRVLAVIAADLHLREATWVSRRELRGDSYHALNQLVSLAYAYEPEWLLVAGDVLDCRRNDAEVISCLVSALDALPPDCQFGFIQGQHDLQHSTPWPKAVRVGTTWLDYGEGNCSGTCYVGPYRLSGLDWRPREALQEALRQMAQDKIEVLLLHQVTQEFMGDLTPAELHLAEDLPPHVKLAVVGDYHVTKTLKLPTGTTVLSPGSTSMQSLDEPLEKFAFLLCEDLSLEEIPLTTRVVLRGLKVLSEGDLEKFIAEWPDRLASLEEEAEARKLPQDLRMPIVEVRYDAAVEGAYRRLRAIVGSSAHLFAKELPKPRKVENDALERRQYAEGGLESCLPLLVDPQQEPQAFAAASRLLRCLDPEAELATMRQQWLNAK